MNEDLLGPKDLAARIPGLTVGNLAQLRYAGTGPKYLRPTPRVILYRWSDVVEWLDASERTSTRQAS